MCTTLPAGRLFCKSKLIVNNMLFLVEFVPVYREHVFAARTNHISCPHVCVAPY